MDDENPLKNPLTGKNPIAKYTQSYLSVDKPLETGLQKHLY